MTDDEWQLVRRWADHGSEPAFADLAGRYVRLVYGRCRRQLGEAAAAEDATQAVLLVLSQKAGSLRPAVPLAAWLYRAAGYACRNEARVRARRARHEAAAATLRTEATVDGANDSDVAALVPLLDAAVDRLGEADRQAVLLRYFEGRSVRDVADELGVTETAAGRRLLRAVDKLRRAFARAGVAVPAAALGATVAAVVAGTAGPTAAAATLPAAATAASRATARAVGRASWLPAGLGTAAAVAVGAVVVGVASTGPASMPAVPPAATSPATATGNVILYPIHVVVSRGLAADVQRVGKPVPSDSVGYAAFDLDGEQAIGLLRGGPGRYVRAYAGTPDAATHVGPDPLPDGRRPYPRSLTTMKVNGSDVLPEQLDVEENAGWYRADLGDGRVTVALDDGCRVDARWKGRPDWKATGRIRYAGDIVAGRAVAFVGPIGDDASPIADLQVWLAVACPPADEPYLAATGPERWVAGGSGGAMDAAAAAAAWNAAAPAMGTDLADRWTRTEPTGEAVRVLAVARPGERPFQWWDPDGLPVSNVKPDGRPIDGRASKLPDGPLSVIVGIILPGEQKRDSPWDLLEVANGPATGGTATVEVTYGVGEWTDGPTLRPGEKSEPIWIDPPSDQSGVPTAPGQTWLIVNEDMSATVQRRVAAVDRAGRVRLPTASGDLAARLASVRRPAWGQGRWSEWVPVAAADVDHYLVQTRPRHAARFAGVRAVPAVP